MKILVVGATGTLGRQIVRHALDCDYEVVCLVRNPKRATFLKEWGAELIKGDLCQPETLPPALVGVEAVIDAATARITDSLSAREVDWIGKVNLIQATLEAGVERYIFISILGAAQHRNVPLMEIKYCTELFLAESGLKYTILQTAGFMQGLIAQYAIPILDNQVVWITGDNSPIAYINTQDLAKFAIKALEIPETEGKTFPVVGPRAWSSEEIIKLCEKLSGNTVKIARSPIILLKIIRGVASFFQWGQNTADRLAFAQVMSSGIPLDAKMDDVYKTFDIDPQEITTLESYLEDYFNRIVKKLKEIGYQQKKQKQKQKRSPFKTKS